MHGQICATPGQYTVHIVHRRPLQNVIAHAYEMNLIVSHFDIPFKSLQRKLLVQSCSTDFFFYKRCILISIKIYFGGIYLNNSLKPHGVIYRLYKDLIINKAEFNDSLEKEKCKILCFSTRMSVSATSELLVSKK